MNAKKIRSLVFTLLMSIFIPGTSLGQSRIPLEYRGTFDAVARGVLNGNQVETNFRNHGEMSRWNDSPWGVWPKNTGGRHIDGIGFIMAAKVKGEYAKWYGEGPIDTTLNPVILNYRASGQRISPYSGNIWGWLPLNGFHNPYRPNPSTPGENEPIPAISSDITSWPEFWPDRLGETVDAGWPDSWNGFRGNGLVTGDQESFYVMDDFSDKEYVFGEEVEGPHSTYGVYYPSPSDSSIGGLGLQTEVRTFQFNDQVGKDMLFTQYRTTNVSEKDLEETWTNIYVDVGFGSEEYDDNAKYVQELDMIVLWDTDGIGTGMHNESSNYDVGYLGILLLEHSIDETNGVDEDQDGMIDESKFNGPGELITGKTAIDAYLEANYDMELFAQNFQDISLFPAYQNERWWTGDEDLDWVGFDDANENKKFDEGEELNNDLGRDGLGPNHSNYQGPDEGEGDGIPTQGEPNFGEQDMLEAENRGVSTLNLNNLFWFEGIGDKLRDDTYLFNILDKASSLGQEGFDQQFVSDDEPSIFFGSHGYELDAGASTYFITVLIFGENEEDLRKKAIQARLIYESDYGQSPLVTNNEDEAIKEIPDAFSLSQNYPNPFNPTTSIEFSLSKTAPVSLTVYDITGREVRSLISEETYNSGVHTVQLNANDLASGIYMYQLRVAGEVFTRKLTLIK